MTITEAWASAERTCFTQLVQYTASKANYNAFQGWLPEDRDSWMFTSGGLAGSFPIERVWGDTPLFCQLHFNAKVVARFKEREDCLTLAGKIINAFNETTNFKQIGNVVRLRLADMPQEPTPLELENGRVIWLMEIPMEMVFSTNSEF